MSETVAVGHELSAVLTAPAATMTRLFAAVLLLNETELPVALPVWTRVGSTVLTFSPKVTRIPLYVVSL